MPLPYFKGVLVYPVRKPLEVGSVPASRLNLKLAVCAHRMKKEDDRLLHELFQFN
jgi:hypothetical protein